MALLENRTYTQNEAKANVASTLVKNVFSTVDQLEQFPKSGPKPPELKKSRYREIIVVPCRIFYREDQEVEKKNMSIRNLDHLVLTVKDIE